MYLTNYHFSKDNGRAAFRFTLSDQCWSHRCTHSPILVDNDRWVRLTIHVYFPLLLEKWDRSVILVVDLKRSILEYSPGKWTIFLHSHEIWNHGLGHEAKDLVD